MMKIYAEIRKIDEEDRIVLGYASTEALDSRGEVIKREAVEAALPDYMRFGNIREMHRASAVGVAKDAGMDDRGLHLKAKIVDDDAWRKIKEGVYKGFSIGGRVTRRDQLDRHIVTGCEISEIRLVDRPANADCIFDVYKAQTAFIADGAGAASDAADLAILAKSQNSLLAKLEDLAGELEALRR